MKRLKLIHDSFYVNNENLSGVTINNLSDLINGLEYSYTKLNENWKLSILSGGTVIHTPGIITPTLDEILIPPTGLTTSGLTDSINLTWINNRNDTQTYIERSEDDVNFSLINITNAGLTYYSDYDVTDGIDYYYKVKSYLGNNFSDYSNTQQGSLLNQIDVNAQAYIDAESITDPVIISAINTLVKDLKAINAVEPNFVNFADNSLSNRKAIYPFPGTGALNARNLMNPVNTDAAKRLKFSGPPVFSSKGVNFEGNKIANTLFNPSTDLDINNCEFDIVHTESGTDLSNGTEFGAYSAIGSIIIQSKLTTLTVGQIGATQLSQSYSPVGFFNQISSKGVTIGDRCTNRDGFKKLNTALASGELPNANLYIGGVNGLARYSNRTYGFASLGKYISDTANELYQKAIIKYNHTLGRAPLVNILYEGHSFWANGLAIGSIIFNLYSEKKMLLGHASLAVSGSKISDVVARTNITDSYFKSVQGVPIKNVEVIWIGANDTADNYDALASYLLAQSAKGWHFIVCTMTPITTSLLPAWRSAFNDKIRANTANIPNYQVFNTDNYPELSDPSNTTYFNADGLHFNATGGQFAGNLIAEMIKAL